MESGLVRWAGAVALVGAVLAAASACGGEEPPGAARSSASAQPTDEPTGDATGNGTGSGVEVSPDVVVDGADLEREVSARLTELAGQAPDDVTCPEEGLAGEVGRTQRCVLTAGTDRLGVTVTVTGVDGARVDFDIEVDDQVMTDPPAPAPSERSTDQPTEGAQ